MDVIIVLYFVLNDSLCQLERISSIVQILMCNYHVVYFNKFATKYCNL